MPQPYPPRAARNALLIDVDGTLINSFPGIRECAVRTMIDFGLPVPSEEELHRLPGPPLPMTLKNFGFTDPILPAAVARFRRYYRDTGWTNCNLFPGWEEMLAQWKAAGFTLCTATSKDQGMATKMLNNLGVAGYFDFIGGADDAAGARQTKRAVIEWVLYSTGLHPATDRILMIGDRHFDLDGAQPLGIPTVLVGWGHGSPAEHDQADYFAPDFPALEEIVAGHFPRKS